MLYMWDFRMCGLGISKSAKATTTFATTSATFAKAKIHHSGKFAPRKNNLLYGKQNFLYWPYDA